MKDLSVLFMCKSFCSSLKSVSGSSEKSIGFGRVLAVV